MAKRLLISTFALAILLTLAGSERANAQGPKGRSVTVGKPWRGAPGVTQSVAQIMAREKKTQPSSAAPRAVPLRTRKSFPSPLNDSAPRVSQFPSPRSTAPERAPLNGRRNPQTIGVSFLGAQSSESIWIPPDSMGAVGLSQILVVVNGRIKVFDKSGNLGGLNVDLSTFFAPVLGPTSTVAFDPQAHYDRLSGRWFITALSDGDGLPSAFHNRVMIAVSSGATITSTSSFTFFQFQHDLVGSTPNSDTDASADYDSLGIDANSLYIGVNVYDCCFLIDTTGFVINKADLLNNILTVTAFRDLIGCSGSCAGPFSPRGVDNDDPAATQGFFVGTDYLNLSTLVLRRITYSGGIASISGNIVLYMPSTSEPINVPALGSPGQIDPVGARLFAAQIKKNKITNASTLWTAHSIEVGSDGVACDDSVTPCPDGGRDAARWYEIGNLDATPALVQSGTLFDSAVSNPRFFWIPTVAASGQGHMALGASFASATEYAGVAVAGRLYSDTLGSIQAATIAQSGVSSYTLGTAPYRWGDYSQTVVDPNDDMAMWTFQEYANATDSWGVRVIQLKAPPPAMPSSVSPSSVTQGHPALNVTITGASTSGSGFFDPGPDTGGPGFAKHIAASITGGIVVNSITFNSPTQVTLNISTCNATNGSQDITITNPDGQTLAGPGILNVTGAPVVCYYYYLFPLIFK